MQQQSMKYIRKKLRDQLTWTALFENYLILMSFLFKRCSKTKESKKKITKNIISFIKKSIQTLSASSLLH
jgi:hypothetical protein